MAESVYKVIELVGTRHRILGEGRKGSRGSSCEKPEGPSGC